VRDGAKIRAKVHRLHQLKGNDHVIKDTGGGGGIGRPEERDPQAVWDDVYVNELVSLQAAREVYKVAIDSATKKIDWEQTRALRDVKGA
jgi:N-methylhydantoinase B/oxoprolinase/acetone carboxylase alpha subunit